MHLCEVENLRSTSGRAKNQSALWQRLFSSSASVFFFSLLISACMKVVQTFVPEDGLVNAVSHGRFAEWR